VSKKRIEVLFSPAEYSNLHTRDLSQTTCVVFDILRATTTMLTAVANGASEIIPVSEIPEALALRAQDPNILLAGERDGFRINAAQTGGIDFDFGNSPREFTPEKIHNRRIAITTTNGTRALRVCAHAAEIHIGSFLNLSTVAKRISASSNPNILIICAGTADESSLEDTLAAGALCDEFSSNPQSAILNPQLKDSAEIALATYLHHKPNVIAAVSVARNGRRLLSIPELAPDIAVCFQRDTLNIAARLYRDGAIRNSDLPPS
jgi:2-phosphosulfolactate phosphatase